MRETAQRSDYIPRAANIPRAQTVMKCGIFKSAGDLHALYEGKGVSLDWEIIAYCRIGERSSYTWFVLKYLLGVPKYDIATARGPSGGISSVRPSSLRDRLLRQSTFHNGGE